MKQGDRRVGLLFGGRSVEHEVSLMSARGVAAAMNETDLHCVPLGVTREGRWLSPALSRRILDGDTACVEPPTAEDDGARLVLEPGRGGVVELSPGAPPRPVVLDAIFPLVHGWGGEDGRLQGALELAGVPYVGAGVLGSSSGMDKARSRIVFEKRGLPVCPWMALTRPRYDADPRGVRQRVEREIGWPAFVKPSNGGSSIGITRVPDGYGFDKALRVAFRHDREIVVEKGLDAREIECAVLGNDDPRASGLGEILPSGEFYDYAAKYVDGTSKLCIPAELAEATTEEIRRLALEAFRALGLRGMARVDFLVERESDRIYLNEVNTLPGFTSISMFPKLWQASGLAYPELIQRLVELALETEEPRHGRGRRSGPGPQ